MSDQDKLQKMVQFHELVREMRKLQRSYFRDKDPTVLETCKGLERQVDAAIKFFFDDQKTLFDA